MNRLAAVERIVDSAQGALTVDQKGTGWPSLATLAAEGEHFRVALYVGIIGETHRSREAVERRFQNPGPDRAIEYTREYLPLLIGLVEGKGSGPDLLVGFDAQRRLGKRTRFSMFVATELIEGGLEHGWAVSTNASGELLVAFRATELLRYVRFRSSGDGKERDLESKTVDIAELLRNLVELLGLESMTDLGRRVAAEVAGAPTEEPDEIWAQLTALAERERLVSAGQALDWEAAMAATAAFDDRIELLLGLWEDLGPSMPVPHSHAGFVGRIYEHPRFLAREAPQDLESTVFEIAKRCEPDLEADDLEVFFANGAPTLFLYESVRSHLEISLEPTAKSEGDEDDDGEGSDEDDIEEQAQPVKASVDKLQVIQIFNLVSKGRLDIEPPWQRKDVWSLKRKRELIKSLILGIPLPSIILHKKEGRMSIIDGKQRLTAIMQFLQNEWKLPNYPATAGSPLDECRSAFYAKEGKKSLTDDTRDTLELRNIPALIFEDVPESRLRRIFELYNVTGMKLNAAEIRNAVYQSNPIHRAIYVLAGEGDGRFDLGLGGPAEQKAFSERLRAIYPGSKKRYQGVDFLARYLGYSRAVQRPGTDQFRLPSTSAAINNFFDHRSEQESPEGVAKELLSVMDGAQRFFDLDAERLAFFVRNDKGQRQFNKLVATTHMVAARLLNALIESGAATEADARAAASAVASPPPEKQQRATIWDYQARILLGLRDALTIDVGGILGAEWVEFFRKMEYCLLPPEVET